NGTYYIKVETFSGTETGSYELFVYGLAGAQPLPDPPPTAPFSTTDPNLAAIFPADDLFGGISGDDTIVGGAGPTIFRTKPTDQGGFNSSEQIVNQVPVVSAGPDQTVNVGDTVNLQGSFTDPDNTGGYTFTWTIINS